MNDVRTSEGKETKAQGSDLVRVKFLKVHRDYGYFVGDIGVIPYNAAEDLSQSKTKIQNGIVVTEEPFVEVLSESWTEEVPVIETAPESVFFQVKFLEPHPLFGYFKGDTGTVTSENFNMLKAGGFVELYQEGDLKKGVLSKLKQYFNGRTEV